MMALFFPAIDTFAEADNIEYMIQFGDITDAQASGINNYSYANVQLERNMQSNKALIK